MQPEVELKGDRYVDSDTQNQLIAAAKAGADVVIRHMWTDGEIVEYDALLTAYELNESSHEEKRIFTIKRKSKFEEHANQQKQRRRQAHDTSDSKTHLKLRAQNKKSCCAGAC